MCALWNPRQLRSLSSREGEVCRLTVKVEEDQCSWTVTPGVLLLHCILHGHPETRGKGRSCKVRSKPVSPTGVSEMVAPSGMSKNQVQ